MTTDSLIQLIEAERYDASGNPHYERFNDGLNYAIAIIRQHAALDVMKIGKAIDECIKYGDCSTENLGKAAIAAMGGVRSDAESSPQRVAHNDDNVAPPKPVCSEISSLIPQIRDIIYAIGMEGATSVKRAEAIIELFRPYLRTTEPKDPREDCPWKCKTGDAKCLCAPKPVAIRDGAKALAGRFKAWPDFVGDAKVCAKAWGLSYYDE